jgi:hypothetical protein
MGKFSKITLQKGREESLLNLHVWPESQFASKGSNHVEFFKEEINSSTPPLDASKEEVYLLTLPEKYVLVESILVIAMTRISPTKLKIRAVTRAIPS